MDNKVSEKEHDKEDRLKTIASDLETEKENDPSPSPVMSYPTITHKTGVPYSYALMYHSLPRNISKEITS